MTNITSVNGPLLSFSPTGFITNYYTVNIFGSTFTNIKSSQYSIIAISTRNQARLNISYSHFYTNFIGHVIKVVNNGSDLVMLELQNNSFSSNVAVDSVSGVTPIFSKQTEFLNNTANIILRFSTYLSLVDNSSIVFTNNTINTNQKNLQRYVLEATSQNSTRCPIQLGNTASLFFCNNVGYYREVYGRHSNFNCTWVKNKTETPTEVYGVATHT